MNKYKAHAIFDNVSFADYLQMTAATAITISGGPQLIITNSFAYQSFNSLAGDEKMLPRM